MLKSRRPFTLLELMIVMAIFILLLVAGMPSFLNATRSTRVNLAAQKIQGALANARTRAVANNSYVAAVFYSDNPNSYYFLVDLYATNKEDEDFRAMRIASNVEALPENTMIPAFGTSIASSDFVTASSTDDSTGSRYRTTIETGDLPELKSFNRSELKPVIFTPKGGLAGTQGKHLVIRVAESDSFNANKASCFVIPVNVNFLSGKAKILPAAKY